MTALIAAKPEKGSALLRLPHKIYFILDFTKMKIWWAHKILMKRAPMETRYYDPIQEPTFWQPTIYVYIFFKKNILFWLKKYYINTCEGGERKPARVFSVKPARKMISNIDYPIISHLSNMPTFFWAKTRQIRGADTPRGRNVPGKEAGQRQTKWHTVWCAISICHTWPRR